MQQEDTDAHLICVSSAIRRGPDWLHWHGRNLLGPLKMWQSEGLSNQSKLLILFLNGLAFTKYFPWAVIPMGMWNTLCQMAVFPKALRFFSYSFTMPSPVKQTCPGRQWSAFSSNACRARTSSPASTTSGPDPGQSVALGECRCELIWEEIIEHRPVSTRSTVTAVIWRWSLCCKTWYDQRSSNTAVLLLLPAYCAPPPHTHTHLPSSIHIPLEWIRRSRTESLLIQERKHYFLSSSNWLEGTHGHWAEGNRYIYRVYSPKCVFSLILFTSIYHLVITYIVLIDR